MHTRAAEFDRTRTQAVEPAQVEFTIAVESAGTSRRIRAEHAIGADDRSGLAGIVTCSPYQQVVAEGVEAVGIQPFRRSRRRHRTCAHFLHEDQVAQALRLLDFRVAIGPLYREGLC